MRAVANKVNLTDFTLDKTTITGKVGDTVVVNKTSVTPQNATNSTVNVTVNDTTVATPSTAGNQYSFVLKKAGSTSARFVADDGSGVSKTVAITVTAAQ